MKIYLFRNLCDGNCQCSDCMDEINCPTKPPEPSTVPEECDLKLYPKDQSIEEGQEVVFQCRDEGPLRARVNWIRSGLNLPPGTTFLGFCTSHIYHF